MTVASSPSSSSSAPSWSALPVPSSIFHPTRRHELARLLADYARDRRWFRAKSKTVQTARIVDFVPLNPPLLAPAPAVVTILELTYNEGGADLYMIPLAAVDQQTADRLEAATPHAIVSRLSELQWVDVAPRDEVLADGLVTGQAATPLLEVIRYGRSLPGESGQLRGQPSAIFDKIAGSARLSPTVPRVEQTNSTILFGQQVLLKIYRQLAAGPNPELEMGQFLTERCHPRCAPRVLGALSYLGGDGQTHNLGVVHEFVPNDGDAWSLALRELRDYFGRVCEDRGDPNKTDLGRFGALASTLGRRTAQLHLALAAAPDDPLFAAEPLTPADREVMASRAGRMLEQCLIALTARIDLLDPRIRPEAQQLVAGQGRKKLAALLEGFRDRPTDVIKTRTHGDLHLGQVLSCGEDFVIVDFEGEPSRPADQRRAKSSPLRDVMGMVRSFDYAAAVVLRERPVPNPIAETRGWATSWTRRVTDRYLKSYLQAVAGARFVPAAADELSLMLDFYELEKVIYEVGYELDNRPDWVEIPLGGMARIAGIGDAT